MRERLPAMPSQKEHAPSPELDQYRERFEAALHAAPGGDRVPQREADRALEQFAIEATQILNRLDATIIGAYDEWRRKMRRAAEIAGMSLIGLGTLNHVIDIGEAVYDEVTEQDPRGDQYATYSALSNALRELPPGPIRAVLQTDIERAYGTFADGNWSVSKNVPTLQDHDAEQAVVRFQNILAAIEDGSAKGLKQAIEDYAQAIVHLNDERRDKVEYAIMQWHSEQL